MTLLRREDPLTGQALAALAAATDQLLASIDGMPEEPFAKPSLLPGWTRAHVLAHLALNAKGLAGVLTTLGQARPLPMYASDERRDQDIAVLAAASPQPLADRVAVGAAVLSGHLGGGPAPEDALEAVGSAGPTTPQGRAQMAQQDPGPCAEDDPSPQGLYAPRSRSSPAETRPDSSAGAGDGTGGEVDSTGVEAGSTGAAANGVMGAFAQAAAQHPQALASWSAAGTFERTPGGRMMSAEQIPLMRWREVEIHHADLGLGYGPSDWPEPFAQYLLAVAAYDRDPELNLTLRTVPRGAASPDRPPRATPTGPAPRLAEQVHPFAESEDLVLGSGGPVVTGTAAALAWWLVGRGIAAGLSSDGPFPDLGPWVRR